MPARVRLRASWKATVSQTLPGFRSRCTIPMAQLVERHPGERLWSDPEFRLLPRSIDLIDDQGKSPVDSGLVDWPTVAGREDQAGPGRIVDLTTLPTLVVPLPREIRLANHCRRP